MAGPDLRGPPPTLADYQAWVTKVTRVAGGRPAPDNSKPIISIITPTFNAEATLPQTLDSIAAQTYQNLEVIVVDGGSRDGTHKVLEALRDTVSFWISESDEGISDAFNRGIALASGDYIQITNADDWLSPDQMQAVVQTFDENPSAAFVFGNLNLYTADRRFLKRNEGKADYSANHVIEMPHVPHATVCAKHSVYQKVGLFRQDIKIAMDLEWLMRTHMAGLQGVHYNDIVGNMPLGGNSSTRGITLVFDNHAIYTKYGVPWFHRQALLLKGMTRALTKKMLCRVGLSRLVPTLQKANKH